jgi:hypothetical protein
LKPFDESVIIFFDELSKLLMADSSNRAYPDIVTFAFFCRRGNLHKLQRDYPDRLTNRLGRGISFHIAPSNIPINFAYSFLMGLLSGNVCIIRVSSKKFTQIEIICNAINNLLTLSQLKGVGKYISIIRYGHDLEINNFFSSLCDVRIIWGGDETISNIRNSPLSPRAFDITFANRYSICTINAASYNEIEDKAQIAGHFYNDTYLFDQNACSSPSLIYWVGEESVISEAKAIFWSELYKYLLIRGYDISPITSINKRIFLCQAAIKILGSIVHEGKDSLIHRIELSDLPNDLLGYKCFAGTFLEFSSVSLNDLYPIITKEFQTLTYIGYSKGVIVKNLIDKGVKGIDRVVPVGRAADFGIVWDGFNLILQMSREIYAD